MPEPIAALQLHAVARTLAFLATAALLAVVLGYAIALVAAGAAARRDRVLPLGEAKYICEIDCHLAYTVTDVRAAPGASRGTSYLVTVRTRFDERTTGARRGDAPLSPNPRRVRLVDARGRAYPPTAVTGTPLDTPLRPGESYETTLAFDLPRDAERPALELGEAIPVTRLLVGHENSPLHGRMLLALTASGGR
jgi:hypothetical protein